MEMLYPRPIKQKRNRSKKWRVLESYRPDYDLGEAYRLRYYRTRFSARFSSFMRSNASSKMWLMSKQEWEKDYLDLFYIDEKGYGRLRYADRSKLLKPNTK